jgi:hypothetical protein
MLKSYTTKKFECFRETLMLHHHEVSFYCLFCLGCCFGAFSLTLVWPRLILARCVKQKVHGLDAVQKHVLPRQHFL